MADNADQGNAVTAEWVGPSGTQLYDGTILNPGTVIAGIGKDEAENSDNWKVVASSDEAVADIAGIRNDWSFGTEEGGEGTGRPLLESQDSGTDVPKAPTSDAPTPDPTPTVKVSSGAASSSSASDSGSGA